MSDKIDWPEGLSPEQLQVLGKAFDAALVRVRVRRLDPEGTVIATAIVECAKAGESDPDKLADAAVAVIERKHGAA